MTMPNPSWAMATVIIDELVRNGIEQVVVAPGSRSGALSMVAAGDSRLRLTVAIDERSAGFWAVGYAKAAGRAAAVLTTSGTAVANLFPAVVEASESLTPLVVVTSDRPFDLRFTGANQTIDQFEIFGRYPRFFADVFEAVDVPGENAEWRAVVCNAVAAAVNGPVHLNVGFREPLVPASDDGRDVAIPYQNDVVGRPQGEPWVRPAEAVPAVDVLELGGRDLVVAGGGASQQLVDDALDFGVPIVAEAHSNCRVPGTITTAHHLLSGGFRELVPSRVIVLGRAGLSRPLSLLIRRVPTLLVRPAAGDPTRKQLPLVEVSAFAPAEIDHSWHSAWLGAEEAARRIVDAELDRDSILTEPRAARDLWSTVPAGSVLAVGSSMPVRDLDWFAPPRNNLHVVSNRGASGIDGFISLALGAAAARQPAYGLVGDLSFFHDSNGFLSTPRPDLTLVVINNQGGGIFSFLPQAEFPEHFERVFATPAPVDLEALARAYGLEHGMVRTAADLGERLQERPTGVSILEVRTDRKDNVAVHRRITQAVVAGVGAIRGLTASPPA
ncbi:MAG: 2-succinyl-5-enolpyruvyl-6-hydroxy-3-cyclohexene-1-carboxylic-acid synthase [Acidimicrobiia bacterium]